MKSCEFYFEIQGHGKAIVLFGFRDLGDFIWVGCRGQGIMFFPDEPEFGPPSSELAQRIVDLWISRFNDFDFEAHRKSALKRIKDLGLIDEV